MGLKKLPRQNPSKSPGPGVWHPYFLRELANKLRNPLYILFHKSLKWRIALSDWLKASITVVDKKRIIERMTKNGLLVDEQDGFVPYRNCMTNLFIAIED